MITKRPYQEVAINRVRERWAQGSRRVCLVAPTGSGKTYMAQRITEGEKVLFVAHRNELIGDTEKIPGSAGATIQDLSQTGRRPEGHTVIVLDECHTVGFTPEWRKVLADYPDTRILGLTATPERRDGAALGDMFDDLVVAARYSDLIESGHIVPCRVLAPSKKLDRGIAKSITKAIVTYARPEDQCLVYCSTVEQARSAAGDLRRAGITAECVYGSMGKRERINVVDAYRSGNIRVLTNVFVLTEGVNFPNARVCVLARGCDHVGTYMQIVGRVLRAAPGKKEGLLIDLTGASITHGTPTQDRAFSLDGKPIRADSTFGVTTCMRCGLAFVSRIACCPSCGTVCNEGPKPPPPIRDVELREHYRGDETPDELKQKEWNRLVWVAKATKKSLTWALLEYHKLFPGCKPTVTRGQLAYYMGYLHRVGSAKRFKKGYAYAVVSEFKKKVEVEK